MAGFIDELEKWFDSLSTEELIKGWDESTQGMSDANHFDEDFFREFSYDYEFQIKKNDLQQEKEIS